MLCTRSLRRLVCLCAPIGNVHKSWWQLHRNVEFSQDGELSYSSGVHQSACWCTSPVVQSHFGRSCCALHGSWRVYFITGNTYGFRGPFPPGFKHLRMGWVYHLAHEATLFRGRPTRPEVFLKMPGECRLQPCARIHIKRPCIILVRLVGQMTNTSCLSPLMGIPYLPTPPLGQDMTRSIFTRSLAGFNSEFSFS